MQSYVFLDMAKAAGITSEQSSWYYSSQPVMTNVASGTPTATYAITRKAETNSIYEGNYSSTSNNVKLVQWPLMGGLLHLVQRGGDWAGPV